MSKPLTSGLTPSAPASTPPPRLDPRAVFACSPGNYPWDHWARWARARGLRPALADLGRETIREAFQHGWEDRLMSLCGWRDHGRRMLHLALRSPEVARKRWYRLLSTDGGRVHFDPRTGEWRLRH